MARPEINEEVKAAVRAWGRAKDPDRGARSLADARRHLAPDLAAQLTQEVSEISAEILLALLTREDGLRPGATPVVVEGVELHPKQAERLGAWLEDQPRLAKALGLDGAAWQRLIEQAMTKLGARPSAGDAAPGPTPGAESAKKLVGAVATRFENRPDAGESERSGLRGLLAARGFPKKSRR